DAYRVQQLVSHLREPAPPRVVGRKVGLTSPVVQRQMGVDEPDFGVLTADMAFADAQPMPTELLMQPMIEGEIAFVLGADLDRMPVRAADVMRATEFVVAAIEVVDSRIANWDINIFDTVSDNASSGVFVLSGTPRLLSALDDLRDVAMTLECDGDVVSSGTGAACLGHPVNAVTWLANTVATRGAPLLAGEVVLSGALGPLVPVRPGAVYEARLAGLGSVRANFGS
ncbi:MAG TPA: fumarylacetoacetate hydrolase family protein, partial [Acidimicrobiia bacterium]|nr:fumarylacetoacetate hydrolase family protein [Acidimicrobiia bacterium]